MSSQYLESVKSGMPLVYGGNRVAYVPDTIASAFSSGDSILVVEDTGEVVHIPSDVEAVTVDAVDRAIAAFSEVQKSTPDQINRFYDGFASRLEDDGVWERIRKVNDQDVDEAKTKGRSVTRLIANEKMRQDMIEGLRSHIQDQLRNDVRQSVSHDGWGVDLVTAPLGVVGFVFEGRPNVLADATSVLSGGNTVVFRIGSDALNTATAVIEHALNPALEDAGLPLGAVSLVGSPSRAAGLALFCDKRLSLAVARGSGQAVRTLGALAKQHGIPASLHGTGGAWMVLDPNVAPEYVSEVVRCSLDRKVCNTVNTICVPRDGVDRLMPSVVLGLEQAASERETTFKLHVVESSQSDLPSDLFERDVTIDRADGPQVEKQAEILAEADLGREWEWENSPEVSVVVVDSVEDGVRLCNQYSPQFVLSCVTTDRDLFEQMYAIANVPFFGNGFTRWADGQYALHTPELGLSNWEYGRILARSAVLSGVDIHTLRAKMFQVDASVHR